MKNIKRLAIFAHYDRDNIIDEYVYYYLNELKNVASEICVVSTAKLPPLDISRLKNHGITAFCRPNKGYDFISYKTGLSMYDLSDYDELILCNDSVYGPFFPLERIFTESHPKECDFWGITDSYQTSHHLQSYFIVLRKAAFSSSAFSNFWEQAKSLDDKEEIIRQYEIGLTSALSKQGLKFDSTYRATEKSLKNSLKSLIKNADHYVKLARKRILKRDFYKNLDQKLKNLGITNPTHENWLDTLSNNQSPFIKIELLRDNPVDVSSVDKIIPTIQNMFDYPTSLIYDHLDRMASRTAALKMTK